MSGLEEQVDRLTSNLSVAQGDREKLKAEVDRHKADNEVGVALSEHLLLSLGGMRVGVRESGYKEVAVGSSTLGMLQAVLATLDDASNLPETSGSSTFDMLQAVFATVDDASDLPVISGSSTLGMLVCFWLI